VSLNKLADFLASRGQPGDAQQALAHYQRSLEVREQLLRANPDSAQAARDVSVSLNKLADFLARRGQPGDAQQALAHYQRSLQVSEQLLRANPGSVALTRDVVASHQRIGFYFRQSGRHEQATAHLSECHRILHELHEAGCSLDQQMLQAYQQLHAEFGATPAPAPPTRALGRDEMRESAEHCFKKEYWEAAKTQFQQLLDQGAPAPEILPKLITCHLQSGVLSPATVAAVEQLLQTLEAAGPSAQSKALREQLAAAQPKKPRWKFWK